MNLCSLELSDFEKAALEEAKRLDITKLPIITITSIATDITAKHDKMSDKTAVGITKLFVDTAVAGNGKVEEETRKNNRPEEKIIAKSIIINEMCRT